MVDSLLFLYQSELLRFHTIIIVTCAILQCIFLIWCFVPWESYNGSILIYNNIIKKLVSKYEKQIDEGLKEASALAKDAAKHGKWFCVV